MRVYDLLFWPIAEMGTFELLAGMACGRTRGIQIERASGSATDANARARELSVNEVYYGRARAEL